MDPQEHIHKISDFVFALTRKLQISELQEINTQTPCSKICSTMSDTDTKTKRKLKYFHCLHVETTLFNAILQKLIYLSPGTLTPNYTQGLQPCTLLTQNFIFSTEVASISFQNWTQIVEQGDFSFSTDIFLSWHFRDVHGQTFFSSDMKFPRMNIATIFASSENLVYDTKQ